MTASTYFTPGPNNEPPMFGTKESGAFAWEATPQTDWYELILLPGNSIGWIGKKDESNIVEIDEMSAIALYEKAAMEWIRSKEFRAFIQTDGELYLDDENYREGDIPHINNSPDWLAAARWVYEQIQKG